MNERDREKRLGELLGTLREEHRAPPDLKAGIMQRVRQIPDPVWKRALDWLFRPRTVSLTPAAAGGLALAGLALILTLRPGVPTGPTAGASDGTAAAVGAATSAENRVTRFVFVSPGASSVRMTGDFVSWDPHGIALEEERGTGVWTVDVPLEPGVYQYTFIVNGTEWRPDPLAVSQIDDGFGQTNSVVIVSGDSEA